MLGSLGGPIGKAIVEMIGDNAQLKKDIQEGKDFTEKSTEEMSSSMEAFGASTISAGKTITKELGPAAAAVAVAMQGIFDSFHEGFETIRTETGATGDELDNLVDSAKAVARNVTVPFQDVASVLSEVHVRTKLTGPALEELTQQVLELAEVTGVDATESVTTFIKLLQGWKVATEDQAATLDLLFRASQQTGEGIDDIAQNVITARTTFQDLGFSLNETIALVSHMGSSFPKVFAGIKVALATLSQDPDVKNIPAEFERIVEQIENAGSTAKANRLAIELFGTRAGPLLAAMIREGKFAIEDWVAALEGGTDTIHQAREDTLTLADRLLMLKNRFVGAVGPTAQWIATIATIATGIGPLVTGIGLLIKAVGGLTVASITNSTAMTAMGVAWLDLVAIAGSTAAAIGVVTLAVAAVGAAIFTWTQAYNAWRAAQDEHNKSVEASGSLLEAYAKNVELGAHSMADWKRMVEASINAEGLSAEEKRNLSAEADRLTQALKDGADASSNATHEQQVLAAAHREVRAAALAEWSAELALAGGFLGVQGAAMSAHDAEQSLAEARAKVARLTEHGKRGTEAYKTAIQDLHKAEFDAITGQAGLENAVSNWINSLKSGDATQKEAIAQVRDFGERAGLSADRVDALIQKVKEHIRHLNEIPDRVETKIDELGADEATQKVERLLRGLNNIARVYTTDVFVRYTQVGNPNGPHPIAAGGVIAGASGFITKGPTFLVGEGTRQTFAGRGAEAVIPFDSRGIGILADALGMALAKHGGGGAQAGRGRGGPMNLHIHFPWGEVARSITTWQEDQHIEVGGR